MGKRGKLPKNNLPVSTTEAVKPDRDYEARERRYKAEEALSTIERAEKHKADKGLMKDVKSLAKEKIKCLDKI